MTNSAKGLNVFLTGRDLFKLEFAGHAKSPEVVPVREGLYLVLPYAMSVGALSPPKYPFGYTKWSYYSLELGWCRSQYRPEDALLYKDKRSTSQERWWYGLTEAEYKRIEQRLLETSVGV